MSKFLRIIGLGAACLSSCYSYADNFSYSAFEVRVGSSPSTFGFETTTNFIENTHLVLRGDSQFSGDWDVATGIGFNGPMNQFMDVYGQMLVHNINDEGTQVSNNRFETEINIGTRFWIVDQIELNARLGRLIGNDDTNSIFGVGVRFHSTSTLSLGADMRNNGVYGYQLLMSARFNF